MEIIVPQGTILVVVYTYFILCIGMFCLHVYMCTEYTLDACGGENGALDFLEMELQMIVGHRVCGGGG